MNKKHPSSKAPASSKTSTALNVLSAAKMDQYVRPKIPQPVFPARLEVTASTAFVRDQTPLLVNWPTMIKVFTESAPSADKLRKLIVVEVQTRNRPTMLRRLLSRLHIVERQELMKALKID